MSSEAGVEAATTVCLHGKSTLPISKTAADPKTNESRLAQWVAILIIFYLGRVSL